MTMGEPGHGAEPQSSTAEFVTARTLYRDPHRRFRSRARDLREQLPGRQGQLQVGRAVEGLQARIAAGCSAGEKAAPLRGRAPKFYRLGWMWCRTQSSATSGEPHRADRSGVVTLAESGAYTESYSRTSAEWLRSINRRHPSRNGFAVLVLEF